MGEIFFSFAGEDRGLADRVAQGLAAGGNTRPIWLDAPFDLTTDDKDDGASTPFSVAWARALRRADCVLVLWTKPALTSPIVLAEATEAADTDRLVNVIFEPDVGADDVPAAFHKAPMLAIEDDTNDFAPVVTYLNEMAARAQLRARTWTGVASEDPDVLTSRLVALVNDDAGANWLGFCGERETAFVHTQRTAFAAAVETIAQAPDPAWREALSLLDTPETRLAGLYRLEMLAEDGEADVHWRRAIGDLAWPHYPIRTAGQAVLAGAPPHEVDAVLAPYSADTLQHARSGEPVVGEAGHSGQAVSGSGDSVGGIAWLLGSVAVAGVLVFMMSQFESGGGDAGEPAASGAMAGGDVVAVVTGDDGADAGVTAEDVVPGASGALPETLPGTAAGSEAASGVSAGSDSAFEAAQEMVNTSSDVSSGSSGGVTEPVTEPVTGGAGRDGEQGIVPGAVPGVVPGVVPGTVTGTVSVEDAVSLADAGGEPSPMGGSLPVWRDAETARETIDGSKPLSRAVVGQIARDKKVPTRRFKPQECVLAATARHTVAARQTLWSIAKLHYGAGCGARAGDVYAANLGVFTPGSPSAPWRKTDSPNELYVGETLLIPPTDNFE